MFSANNRKADFRTTENPPSGSLANLPPNATIQLLQNIASLEKALYEETDRRISSQEQIREQVDSKIKAAVERLADATETEMARMYRRLEAELMNRIDGFSRELQSMSSSVAKLNRQVELVTVEIRDNRDRVQRIEKRMSMDIVENGSGSEISKAGTIEMVKLHEIVQNDIKSAKKINDLHDLVTRKVMTRIESIEEWLKGNLTPEILRLKESIKAEQITREDHDREIMALVGQYTDIMRRHFDSISDSPDEIEVAIPEKSKSISGREKLVRKLIDT
jgi:hypothetical protein